MSKILIIEHRRYNDVADLLLKSVINTISGNGVEYDLVSVPRLRDLPVTVSYAEASPRARMMSGYIGYILIGARLAEEEKFHEYPLTCILQDVEKIKLDKAVAIGTGIVSGCNTVEEALAVAPEVGRMAAINCLKLLAIKRSLM
jgi:6,7-dimethyl-8-ribityllumazine synthase